MNRFWKGQAFDVLIIDLDGTLLTSGKRITPFSLDVLQGCLDNGVHVILATARPPRSVREFVPFDFLKRVWKICYNGALVLNPKDELILHQSIASSTCHEVYSALIEHNSKMAVALEIQDVWYGNRVFAPEEKTVFGIPADAESPPIFPFSSGMFPDVSKILAVDECPHKEVFQQFHEQLNIVITDNGRLMQIMAKNASKDIVAIDLLQTVGVIPDRALVFGDDINDLQLFHTFRHCVAMANAVDELKAIAWKVAESNDSDGVARMVNALEVI